MAAKKVDVFFNGYNNEVVLRCNGTDRHEIRAKNVNRRPAVLNLDKEF